MPNTFGKILLFFLVLALLPIAVLSQKIRLYSTEHGLPNSLINKVYQDDRGYIWIATENGAAYFDGLRFTTFRRDKNKNQSLSNDLVKTIFTDSRGVCWIGTSTGLQQFDYRTNIFHNYSDTSKLFPERFFVSAIVESPQKDKLLISLAGTGIIVLNTENYETDMETTAILQNLYNTIYIGNLFFDSEGYLWSFSEQGHLFRTDINNRRANADLWAPELQQEKNHILVSAITEDPVSKSILIGTHNHGIFIFDRKLGYIRRARGKTASKFRIRALLASRDNSQGNAYTLWAGTEDKGLRKFNRDTEEIEPSNFQYAPIDLDHCKVHSLVQDSQGNIWAGVYQKGLLIIPKTSNSFEYMKVTDKSGTLSTNLACVTSIVRDHHGSLWVGTDGGGLFRYKHDEKPERFTHENSPLHNNAIMALAVDHEGRLWISTYMGGLITYHENQGFNIYSNENLLQKVHCMHFDQKDKQLYLGTLGKGTYVINLANKSLKRLPGETATAWLSTIYKDNDQIVWTGRTDGIRCFNSENGSEIFNQATTSGDGKRIYSFCQNTDSTIWIGTAEGLMCFNKNRNQTILYTEADGLPNNLIYTIQRGTSNELWIGTAFGLSVFNISESSFRNFYTYDGIQDNEFRMGASFKDTSGKLYFGGTNGITTFFPNKVEIESHPVPNINFSRLTVFNQTIDYDPAQGKHNLLDQHISQAKQITLKHTQNVFSIDFAVLEYANPQKVVYGYMLKGFDNNWQFMSANNRSVTYTNLPDGHYTFQVKAFFEGNESEENMAFKEINIRILPPWHKTWWAYLLYLSFVMAIVRIALNNLIKNKLRRKERHESEKKEMKLKMFTDLSHEIRTPLTLVMTPLKTLRENETDYKKIEIYNLMYRNVLRILRLINQLMDLRKIDNHQLQMHFNKTDLIFFVKDIMKSFEQLALVRNIDFRLVTHHDSLMVWLDQSNFDKVMFNIISNAFKYTPDNGFVMISIDRIVNSKHNMLMPEVSEKVEIRIENSGSSVPEKELERIFDRFYQVNNDPTSGSGIGLHLAKMIVKLHHGEIKARNTEKGLIFLIAIPLGDKHLTESDKSNATPHKDLYATARTDEKQPHESEYLEIPDIDDEFDLHNSKNKRNLVFVDDDRDLCKYIQLELSDQYNVEVCYDGKEAWKVISTTMPHAVVTDLVMPESDGLALCKKIKQNPNTNDIPVIVLTSLTDEENERLCIENGADRFLTKPISLELLRISVAQAIQTRDTLKNKYRSKIDPDFAEIQMSSPDNKLITKVIENIRKNIENPDFGVDHLAQDVGLSRVHLNRKLKENINLSPNSLIRSIRMKQAAYLLIKNKVNVSEVAYKVGFSSHSYFSNNFKEYFGMSPSEFVSKYTAPEERENLNRLFEN
jgi:signal transduction histidine kinase/ligand-binding sensor domain-containing protein/DNA-binding response OmpR family regulator